MADKEKKSKQQKPKSKTVKTIQQPKPEEKEDEGSRGSALDKNLCDDCIYEFGECDGQPKFASEFQEGLTGAAADQVVECLAHKPVDKPVVQDEVEDKEKELEPEPTTPWAVAYSRLDEVGRAILNERAQEIEEEAERRFGDTEPTPEDIARTFVLIVEDMISENGQELSEEMKDRLTVKPEGRPDPNRFRQDEDFGTCQSCGRPLKRTALNQYQDAIRCTNPRCGSYRWIVRLIPSGAK